MLWIIEWCIRLAGPTSALAKVVKGLSPRWFSVEWPEWQWQSIRLNNVGRRASIRSVAFVVCIRSTPTATIAVADRFCHPIARNPLLIQPDYSSIRYFETKETFVMPLVGYEISNLVAAKFISLAFYNKLADEKLST